MHGYVDIGDAVNWDAPLNRGLVSWWMALPEQQRGVMFRDLCRRNDGTLTNGPLWIGPGGRPGWGALSFATDDYVACGNSTNLDMTGDITFAGWAYLTNWADGAHQTFISKGNHVTGEVNYLVGKTSGSYGADSNSLKFVYNDTGFRDVVCPGATGVLASTTWHFPTIVVRKAAAEVDFYNNGKLLNTVSDGNGLAYVTSTGPLRLGINGSAGEPLNGRADAFRLYNRALSASEVLSLYRAACGGYEQELNWYRPRESSVQIQNSILKQMMHGYYQGAA